MRVQELIDAEGSGWNVQKINDSFYEDGPNYDGIHIVKSGYWMVMLDHTRSWKLQMGQ